MAVDLSGIYISAYAGAICGMTASNRVVTDANPQAYAHVCAVAGAFASMVEHLWNEVKVTSLDNVTVQNLCAGVWQERTPGKDAKYLDPETYRSQAAGIIAIVNASQAFFESENEETFIPLDVEEVAQSLIGIALTADTHAALRQLIHLAAEGGPFEDFLSGAVCDTLPAGNPFPTMWTWYSGDDRLKKIMVIFQTYTAQYKPATITYSVYDESGQTVIAQFRDTIVYSNYIFEQTRKRVRIL